MEEGVVDREGNSYQNECDRDNDNGEGDRRGFLPTTVCLVLSSGRKLLFGFLHSDGQLPSEDDVANDETDTRKNRVDEQIYINPKAQPELLIVS